MRLAPCSALLAGLIALPASAGNVIVVDASGGGDYAQIQSAVVAAIDGDTILVRRGLYSRFTVDDKSLVVVADNHADVRVAGVVLVKDLAPDRHALLVGLRIVSDPAVTTWPGAHALEVLNNAGPVRLEDCLIQGNSCGTSNCLSGSGMKAHGSPDVALARCEVTGGNGGFAAYRTLESLQSRCSFYECIVRGGSSQDEAFDGTGACSPPEGGNGAVFLQSSFVFGSGSLFAGGDGGMGSPQGGFGCACGIDSGWGGTGLALSPTSDGWFLDSEFEAGEGAPSNPSCADCCGDPQWDCCPGSDGQATSGAPVTMLGGQARRLVIANPRREQPAIPIRVEGLPQDEVYLFLSDRSGFRFVPGYRGVQLTRQPGPPIFLGVIGPTGVLNRTIPYAGLGGHASATVFLQAAHRNPYGRWTLGSPVSLVVLDTAY